MGASRIARLAAATINRMLDSQSGQRVLAVVAMRKADDLTFPLARNGSKDNSHPCA